MSDETSGRSWILIALLAVSFAAASVLASRPEYWPGFVAAVFTAGALTAMLWRQGDVSMKLVVAGALVFRVAVFWLPPTLSDDAYRYVWDGHLQAEGHNPFLHTPDDPQMAPLWDEEIYAELNSPSYFSVYPPVSQFIFRIGAVSYDSGWRISYFVIKGILALMEFGAVLVLARLLTAGQLLVYAWNPLVVLSGAGQAHGEAALVLFLSLSLLALHKKKGALASGLLACAGWVKLYPFVLLPFVWRRYGWRSVLAGVATAGLLAVPYAHPAVLANVSQSLELYVRLFEFNAGPYYAVKQVFLFVTGQDWSKQIGPAFGAAYVALLPVLYVLDWKRAWSPRRAFAVTVGAFFCLSTTVHPWYLLGILVLVAPLRRPSWHWIWLSVVSIGTYLLYVDGPYWTWVILGWTGWLFLAGHRYRRALVDPILRNRAADKVGLLSQVMEGERSILDIGAAEGYVGRALAQSGAAVELVDVVDMNRTNLPHRVYDGATLPYPNDRFDAAVLVFVLHHAEDPETVVREALRVSRGRVVILESTYEKAWERPLLRRLDKLVNGIRSEGKMREQEAHLHFRTHQAWLDTFDRLGARVANAERRGGFIHHQSLFVLDARVASDKAWA